MDLSRAAAEAGFSALAKLRGWELLVAELLAARPGMTEREAALAAKVGVACVQAAFDSWVAAPHTDLVRDVDHAFGQLAKLAEGVARA